MVEISKMSDVSILHLFGQISLLEMDWVSGMMEIAGQSVDKKAWFHLAQTDHDLFQAVKKNIARTPSLSDSQNFSGADQRMRDYSAVADSVLSLINQPVSPVKVTMDQSVKKSRLDGRMVTMGLFYH